MRDDQLAAKPFHLDGAAIAWVRDTLKRLTPDDKIRQLFNLRIGGNDPGMLKAAQAFRPGSITRMPGADWTAERRIIDDFNAAAPVPLTVIRWPFCSPRPSIVTALVRWMRTAGTPSRESAPCTS